MDVCSAVYMRVRLSITVLYFPSTTQFREHFALFSIIVDSSHFKIIVNSY